MTRPAPLNIPIGRPLTPSSHTGSTISSKESNDTQVSADGKLSNSSLANSTLNQTPTDGSMASTMDSRVLYSQDGSTQTTPASTPKSSPQGSTRSSSSDDGSRTSVEQTARTKHILLKRNDVARAPIRVVQLWSDCKNVCRNVTDEIVFILNRWMKL